ncbi:MAG TPA: biotin/lipoyl-containing protein, partial [Verrucomicrobiae bacterium]|nr:biotin/lipoyl-containing protein [Verrucomicrobiae bacterium]
MPIELKVPAVGESITEVEIGDWLKHEGDTIAKDETVVTLESEKATVELPSPAAGRLAKILKQKGQTAAIGEVIGHLEAVDVSAGTPSKAPEKNPETSGPTKQKGNGQPAVPAA